MAKCIHGELEFANRNMGQISDLMCILVTNGFTVEIAPSKDGKIVIIIMTEVE